MTTLTNAIYIGYTEIDKPAQFKVATKTRIVNGVEVVEFYNYHAVKNGDEFSCGVTYDIEIIDGYATVICEKNGLI
jgi:hypothetical protein